MERVKEKGGKVEKVTHKAQGHEDRVNEGYSKTDLIKLELYITITSVHSKVNNEN